MDVMRVRIDEITIINFKNVIYGRVSFDTSRKNRFSSIVGIYGQNGSGKTALIDAVDILRHALTSTKLPSTYAGYVNVDASHATIKYVLSVFGESTKYTVNYELSLRAASSEHEDDLDATNNIDESIAEIFNEKLSYSYQSDNEKKRMQPVIDTNCAENDVFIPATKYDILTGGNKDVRTDLLVAKGLAKATSKSFIFSKKLQSVIHENCTIPHYEELFNSLIYYGNRCLFIINTVNNGLISLNALPISFSYKNKGHSFIGNMPIPLNSRSGFPVPEKSVDILDKVICDMNIVLAQLVPGLTIKFKQLGTTLLKDGSSGVYVQLVSLKNRKEIPLQYESDGIKKIVSILQLLIVVYNDPSVSVAIDELDSGIFEYLLGEILRIISDNGKGQLIFTSHNLRPLETLDSTSIVFTTTNPQQRYIRLSNIKQNNNLRDSYYRRIMLGANEECLYDTTNNSEISLAFRKAGRNYER
ncbi:MAG: AAA family ATPase [Oscillospiraceae bacterium]|nr:AAA family ATPase [Oscillospiraceae bacterium]